MNFEFGTTDRIYVGAGAVQKVASLAATLGSRVLIVHQNPTRSAFLFDLIRDAGIIVSGYRFSGEPTIAAAREGVADARSFGAEVVIAMGGGSALDMGKAIAALVTNGGDPLDYLEVIGHGKALTRPSLPFIAIPTTAGTGAEATANAVLASPEDAVKVSLRSPFMLPRAAIIDPDLTRSLPPDVTAYTGMDALTQVIEPFVSPKATPITDALCREGIVRIAGALASAYHRPSDNVARENMAIGALLGGMALANAKLGAVHGFAAPLGGMFESPHGAVCAALLPYVMQANVQAMQSREPQNPALRRYDEVARLLTGRPEATASAGIDWVFGLTRTLAIPGLSRWNVDPQRLSEVAEKAAGSSSMAGNPVRLTQDELTSILNAAL